MNKKIVLSIYYAGLIIGAIIINYMLLHYIEYADSIMDGFREMDKLQYVDRQELFFYIFFKRAKQIVVLCFLYLQLSKMAALFFLEFYFAMVEGMVLSLCTYYCGISGVLTGTVMLVPQFLFYALLQIAGWRIYENKKNNLKISPTRWVTILIVQILVVTISELIVNFLFGVRFFVNK